MDRGLNSKVATQSAVHRAGEIVVLKESDVSAKLKLMAAFDPG